MNSLSVWMAATAAFAAFAQAPVEPAPKPASRAGDAASAPLTRQELLACIELEEGIKTNGAALDARVAQYNQDADTAIADGRSIEEAQKALKGSDKAPREALTLRAEAYSRRASALNAIAQGLNAEAGRLGQEVERYQASCANRPYAARERQQALFEYRDGKAAAAAAAPFEAGLKAFDQGKYEEALRLWLPLAEQERPSAQHNIAVMYEQGLGVTRSDVEAARWYARAAEHGDVASQLKIGTLYEAGAGVSRDLGSASYWYAEAAKGGAKDADAARQARELLARLPKAYRAGPDDVVGFDGGRFVLRRAASKECVVALQGTVTFSASFKFDEVLTKAKAQDCARPLTLLLESPGGYHNPGLELARSVRAEGMRTVARYACASSCATIFLGGTERVLWGARAAIGFHQLASVRDGNFETGTCIGTRDDPGVVALRRYLHVVVPETSEEIYRIVMTTPCKSITWVKGKRALDLQVATRVEAEAEDVFGPPEERTNTSASAPR